MNKEIEEAIKSLTEKAGGAREPDAALKFSQAALNISLTLSNLRTAKAAQQPEQ